VRVVAALGGNALLRRGQARTAENQGENAHQACKALAPVALEHELVIAHGNGPQVGLLALQGAAYPDVQTYPLDVLGAQTEDVDAVYTGWGTPEQAPIRQTSPAELSASQFASGSMGPKVRAACWFVERTGGRAAIGSIHETAALVRGEAGTIVWPESAEAETTAGRSGR